jgi:hypothetical protein
MEELQDLKRRMEQERPASWSELPDIALYMDQLVSYMPRQLIRFDDSETLTSAMVNNYIKDGLVPRAEGKRYAPVHLGYLTAVCALKKVLSVRDVGTLLAAGQSTGKSNQELYDYFCRALDRALTDTSQTIDENAQRSDLPKIALDLALRSYANQLACARILDILQPHDSAPHKGRRGKET